MVIEQNLNETIKFLFNDETAIQQSRLSESMDMDLKQEFIESGENVILCITDIKCPSLNGEILFQHDGVTLLRIVGNNEPVDTQGITIMCTSIDCIGMNDNSSPVAISYKQYIVNNQN